MGELTSTAKEAVQLANEEALEKITNGISTDELWKNVEISAKNLMDYATELMLKKANKKKKAMINAQLGNNDYSFLENFKSSIVSNQTYFSLMEKVIQLQDDVNLLLGQTIKMIYIYHDQDTKSLKIYQFDNSINEWGSSGKIKKLDVLLKQNFQEMTDDNIKRKENLDWAYTTTYNRYVLASGFRKIKGASAFMLWRISNQWIGYLVPNTGPLKESYFNFFINDYDFEQERKDNVERVNEVAINTFMLHKDYGTIKADTASGFLQGDVNKNKIQYAVKSEGASAMGYAKIINSYASDIYQYAINRDINAIQELKKNLSEEGHELITKQHLESRMNQTLETILKDLEDARYKAKKK